MNLGYVPSPWIVVPFGLRLATIALAPLFLPNWWSRRYPIVSYVLGGITLAYYLFFLPREARQTVLVWWMFFRR
ncbi:MAG TPA: hypothetical protein VJS65_07225 [Verrucomicrobiae bacterium]|nr:hypothetical protein [Verrucomicrobiae bacterium]